MTELTIKIDTDKPKDMENAYNILDALNQVEEVQQQPQEQPQQYMGHPTQQQPVMPMYQQQVQPPPIQLPTPQPIYNPQTQAVNIPQQTYQQPNVQAMPQLQSGQSMQPKQINEVNEEAW